MVERKNNLVFLIYGLTLAVKINISMNSTVHKTNRLILSTLMGIMAFSFFFSGSAKAQVFWVEDFGVSAACVDGDSVFKYTAGLNGLWTVDASMGAATNADTTDWWFVSVREAYTGSAGACGEGCLTNPPLIDRTLHVGLSPLDSGARYNADSAFAARAVSPVINCSTQDDILLSFYYIEGGDLTDNATVWYFDGVTWSMLADMPKTPTVTCGPESEWTPFFIALPSSANNNPLVQIGFQWENNGDGIGTQPSFAVDSILLTNTPALVAGFEANDDTVCLGQVVTFTDTTNSLFGPIVSWQWTFPGGLPASANTPVANVTYGVGSWDVTLIVVDAAGFSDTISQTAFIEAQPCIAPVANFTLLNPADTAICENGSVTFISTSTGPPDSLFWDFPGGNPVFVANVADSVDTITVFYGTPGVYNVGLVASNGAGKDTLIDTMLIEILSCPQPQAEFAASSTNICPGDCIVFSDLSTGSVSKWRWDFFGANPDSSFDQNPVNICYDTTAGEYTVRLIVENDNVLNEPDTLIKTFYIEVDSCLGPTATYVPEDDTICIGSCVTFINTSRNADLYEWKFFGSDTLYDTSNVENPTVCYSDSGFFAVELKTFNQYGNGISLVEEGVHVGTYPTVVAGPDQELLIGTDTDYQELQFEVEITADGTGDRYRWSPTEGLDCSDCQSPIATSRETTKYFVTNTNEFNCSVTDSLVVFVKNQYFAGIPNAFSPNGDDNNDFLYVRGNGIGRLEFFVFNRFGQKVFESFSQKDGWDGRFKNKEVNPGVYKYYVKLTFFDGTNQELRGNVTLFR